MNSIVQTRFKRVFLYLIFYNLLYISKQKQPYIKTAFVDPSCANTYIPKYTW